VVAQVECRVLHVVVVSGFVQVCAPTIRDDQEEAESSLT
jgi:hypothetical protein